jgi:trimethylamine---corrinoid protein Co-methyltransferase
MGGLKMLKCSNLKLLTMEEVDNIYGKCLDFLANKGIKVTHHEPVLKMLDKAGAQIDFSTEQVRFSKDIVKEALRTVPKNYLMASYDKRHDCPVPNPDGKFYTLINTGASKYLDPETNKYRATTLADMEEWAQLCETLDGIDCCSIITATDKPEETCDIYALKTVFENTSKHVIIQPFSFEGVKYLLELAQVVSGSKENLRKRPPVTLFVCPITPFVLDGMHLEIILQCGKLGVPITSDSLPTLGATGPCTMAGTVLQTMIEILGILVVSQMLNPGTPVICRPLMWDLDMTTGKCLHSSIEAIMTETACIQVIKEKFKTPVNSYGFGTDSYVPDAESSMDVTLRGMMVTLSDSDVIGAAGRMAVTSAISPIQLMIDNALSKILKRIRAGIKVDEDTLAWKEMQATPPGGHYLESPHTLKHCRDVFKSDITIREPLDTWESEGSKDLIARMKEKYFKTKKTLKPLEIPPDLSKELAKVVKKADEKLVK